MERRSEHTTLISSYQLLSTIACTNTGGKMKGSHSRAADRCPFVPRHSLSQVTSFMQLGLLWGSLLSIMTPNSLAPGSDNSVISFIISILCCSKGSDDNNMTFPGIRLHAGVAKPFFCNFIVVLKICQYNSINTACDRIIISIVIQFGIFYKQKQITY